MLPVNSISYFPIFAILLIIPLVPVLIGLLSKVITKKSSSEYVYLFKRYWIIVLFITLILGVALNAFMYWQISIIKKEEIEASFLFTLLFACFLIVLLAYNVCLFLLFRHATSMSYTVVTEEEKTLLINARELGVNKIWKYSADWGKQVDDIKILISNCKRRLDIYSLNALKIFESCEQEIQNACKQNINFQLNISVADPRTCCFVPNEGKMSLIGLSQSINPQDVERKTQKLIDQYNDMIMILGENIAKYANQSCKIHLRKFSNELRQSMLIIDEKEAWFSPNLPPAKTLNLPALKLGYNDNSLLRLALNHLEGLYKIYDPDEITANNYQDFIINLS